jgi:hypothetical protein
MIVLHGVSSPHKHFRGSPDEKETGKHRAKPQRKATSIAEYQRDRLVRQGRRARYAWRYLDR